MANIAQIVPVTNGAAIDVPLFHPYPPQGRVEYIETHGAEISTPAP
jgi:hypothetical protein